MDPADRREPVRPTRERVERGARAERGVRVEVPVVGTRLAELPLAGADGVAGVLVAAGDWDADGFDDIVTGADANDLKIWSGREPRTQIGSLVPCAGAGIASGASDSERR